MERLDAISTPIKVVLAVLVIAAIALCAGVANSEELHLGDFGYKHDELHLSYQQYFRRNQEHAFELLKKMAEKLQPGDEGYVKDDKDLTKQYQEVFNTGKCNCSTGECRPTIFRATQVTLDNPRGVEFMVNRVWCKPSMATYFLEEKEVPPELLKDDAHVCAAVLINPITHCPTLECVRVNATQ